VGVKEQYLKAESALTGYGCCVAGPVLLADLSVYGHVRADSR
jgi:hypothetical protein